MKINLHTKMLADFSTVELALERQRIKAREAAEAEKTAKINKEVERLHSLPHFQRGTTTEFVIDLNKDLLDLDQIHQVIISFAQNGFKKAVKREMLFFSDDIRLDKKGRPIKDRSESLLDNTGFDWFVDEDGDIGIKHTHHHIQNPKFTYDKVLNHLVLSLDQKDTLDFDYSEVLYDNDGYPYASGDTHSLVTMEVKIMTTADIGRDVITHYQQFYVYDSLFEEDDLIYRVPRSRVYVGGYAGDGEYRIEDSECTSDHDQLPKRVELLFAEPDKEDHDCLTNVCRYIAPQDILRDGLVCEVKKINGAAQTDVMKYACIAVPINLKIRLAKKNGVEVLYGGHMFKNIEVVHDKDDSAWMDKHIVVPSKTPHPTSWSYRSTYMIDPEGRTEDNPKGEFILWYTDHPFAGEYTLKFNFEEV